MPSPAVPAPPGAGGGQVRAVRTRPANSCPGGGGGGGGGRAAELRPVEEARCWGRAAGTPPGDAAPVGPAPDGAVPRRRLPPAVVRGVAGEPR